MDIYIIKKKSKNDKEYICMYIDLCYRLAYVSYDTNLISEIANLTVADLYKMEVDKPIMLGHLSLLD